MFLGHHALFVYTKHFLGGSNVHNMPEKNPGTQTSDFLGAEASVGAGAASEAEEGFCFENES